MDVSIVIPTFNRAELLPRTLQPLAEQRTDGCSYEVIFVSNGSSDHSGELIEQAVRDYPGRFRYFWIQPTGGPSAPRNFGIRHAQGEVVIILDDDVIPDPDLVQRHWEYHQRYREREATALGEVYVPDDLKLDPMSLFHSFPYSEVQARENLDYLFFWTCNVSVKREFMLECGMFPEDMLYYEDMICGHRLFSHGMKLRFLPQARGQHIHKLKPAGVPQKGLFNGLWLFRFVRRLPEPAVKERFGIFSSDVPWRSLVLRFVKRVAFRLTDNPLTMAVLRILGAERSPRNRITDLYYYLIFRRNMLTGYYQAKREGRLAQPQDA
jgi:glycosyltransferase involved in cell wall biosynthesis